MATAETITIDPDLIPTPGRKTMMWADYLVFALILVVYIVIGLVQAFVKKKPESAKEFMNAQGQMPVFPVVLSLMSSRLSANIILGGSAEIYTQGAKYWLQGFGQFLACLFVALLFVPLLYPLKLASSYEYLELRFKSKTVKICGMLFLVVSQLFYMGVCVYSPATAMEAVTGFPETGSIVIASVVAGLYCILGGMKSSIWIGAIQVILMLFGTMIGIIKPCIDHPDGIKGLWQINEETGRLDIWDFDPNPRRRHTFFTLVFGNMIGWMTTYGVNQASVQRYCSVETKNKGMLKTGHGILLFNTHLTVCALPNAVDNVVLLNGPGLMIITTLCAMSGGTVFAWYYYVGCDPLQAGYLTNANQVLPYYIMDRVGYPCVGGLFMAALLAGALSSVSGSLGALSSVVWQDLFEWKYHYLSERAKTIIQKVLMMIFTGVGIGFGFLVRQLGGTVVQLSVSLTGATGGPMLGLFLLGGLFPCAEWIGATVGSLVGLGVALWLVIGSYTAGISLPTLPYTVDNCVNYTIADFGNTTAEPPKYAEDTEGIEKFYTMSYLYFSSMGVAITIVLGLLVSFIAGCVNPGDAEPYLHIPLFDRLCCCFRNKTLDALRYNWTKKDMKRPEPDNFSISSSSSSSSSGSKKDLMGLGHQNAAFRQEYPSMEKPPLEKTDVWTVNNHTPSSYNGQLKQRFDGFPPGHILQSTAF